MGRRLERRPHRRAPISEPSRERSVIPMSPTYAEGYGPTVSAVRELLGLSRTELADLLEVSMDSVRSWEVGRRPVPAHVADELAALQDRARQEVEHLAAGFARRPDVPPVILLEQGPEAMPLGWQRRIAARVAHQVPHLLLRTTDQENPR